VIVIILNFVKVVTTPVTIRKVARNSEIVLIEVNLEVLSKECFQGRERATYDRAGLLLHQVSVRKGKIKQKIKNSKKKEGKEGGT